jgi:MFS family permease
VGRLPWLVFVLFAGALADRLDRRRTMLVVSIMRVGVMGLLGLLAVTDQLALPALYVAAAVLAIASITTLSLIVLRPSVTERSIHEAEARAVPVPADG